MVSNRKSKIIQDIKQKVLEKIKPDNKEKEKLIKLFEKIKNQIIKEDKEKLIKRIELVGSVAKNTFLKGEGDLDIFIFFDVNVERDKLESYGLDLGKKVMNALGIKYVIKYAEHPYVKGDYKGVKIEIVPAYALKEIKKVVSAVDRTPFHKEFVINNLKNHDEVLLLKKFMKATNTYGSELSIMGFSGYATELLIIKYKSFERVLREATKWKEGEIIVIDKTKLIDKKKIKKRFKDAPLIIIDPVDLNRNVTAALSKQTLMRFKTYAIKFLANPDEKYFSDRLLLKDIDLKEAGRHYFIAKFYNSREVIEDTIIPQLNKLKRLLSYWYDYHDFKVIRSLSYYCDKYYGLFFEFDAKKFSSYKHIIGPDLNANIKRINNFIKKYDKVWIDEEGVLHANTLRKYRAPEELLLDLKNKGFNELREFGVPKNIAYDIHTLTIVKKEKCKDYIKKISYI